jgi:hypothetical protein
MEGEQLLFFEINPAHNILHLGTGAFGFAASPPIEAGEPSRPRPRSRRGNGQDEARFAGALPVAGSSSFPADRRLTGAFRP